MPRRRERPRRAQLRTRVLAGVVAITLAALAAFDAAAAAALRRYLLSQADSQLQAVVSLYRPLPIGPGILQRLRPPRPPAQSFVIVGPHLQLRSSVLVQYYVAFVVGHRPIAIIRGNPDLSPKLPAGLTTLAVRHGVKTVVSSNGRAQLRLLAVRAGAGSLVVTTSLAQANQTVGRLEAILAICSAAAAMLVALGVALVMRRGLRPIELMATQADRITAGDLTDRVSPQDPRSEVGRLGIALNGMLARIETSIREREAGQELARRFFADASHELRNPLASLRANAELYQQGALPDRRHVDEAMRRIALEAQRMSALVDDMLRLARLDQHPGQRHDTVDLTAVVGKSIERAQVTDPARTWRGRVAGDLTAVGDAELLSRAIDNLLANVSAHTPAGTAATITTARCGGTITIAVSDDGPGVPADQLSRIFDRFYRAGAPAQRPGSGLGLAIVTAIATAHNGTAEAASNHPRGLSVTVTLPAPAATNGLEAGGRHGADLATEPDDA